MRNSYKTLVRKPEGKKSSGRPRCRWEDNIRRIDLREVGWEIVEGIHQAQNRVQVQALVKTIMNLFFHKIRGFS
jgi:hypothetical protein